MGRGGSRGREKWFPLYRLISRGFSLCVCLLACRF